MTRECDDCGGQLWWQSPPKPGHPGYWRHDDGQRSYEHDDGSLRHQHPDYKPWPEKDRLAYYQAREIVTYTDGSRVEHGDKARYHQAPGGLLPHGDWVYGTILAVESPHPKAIEYVLEDDRGRRYNLFSHVIERT